MFYTKVNVRVDEKLFVYEKEILKDVYGVGTYRFFTLFRDLKFEKINFAEPYVSAASVKRIFDYFPDKLSKEITEINTSEKQFAVVYSKGVMDKIIPPSSNTLVWKDPRISVDYREVPDDCKVDQNDMEKFSTSSAKEKVYFRPYINLVNVPENHSALVSIDGIFQDELNPGVYGYWSFSKSITANVVDLRVQNMELTGQEILTKDKVSIRLNITLNYLIRDARTVFNTFANYKDSLYKALQLKSREVLGTRTLDEILSDKDTVNGITLNDMRDELASAGLKIDSVGIKDIILPGDMKELLNKVVEAEKIAAANNIRRREETAATRSLNNTARMIESNPTLMRLKELEALEKITDKIDKITVNNGFDGILNDLVKIREK